MSEMTITVDEADEIREMEAHEPQVVSKHRWYTKLLIPFTDEAGALRGFFYLDPASELQEGQDRYESDPVKTFAVTSREVTTIVYVADV